MPQNYITLPRSALYELVWTKPVTELAKEFGISDVALAKRCRSIKIPLPPRGYWARVTAGQRPRRPPLPPFTDRQRGVQPSYVTARAADGTPAAEPAMIVDPSRTAEKLTIDESCLPAVTVPASTDLAETLPIVKRTAKHYKHARRTELELKRGEATGPIVRLNVSPDSLERALLFADTFLKAAAELTCSAIPPREPEPPDPRHYYGRPPEPKPDPGPHYADLDVDGKRIQFLIEERCELRELPPTTSDLAQQKKYPHLRLEKRYETIWSGRLRLKRPGHHYPYGIDGKSWFETKSRTLDVLIPRILADFRAVAGRMKEVDERLERARLEEERQQQLRKELAERREANQKFICELERQAGAWHRAQFLRRYVRAARRALGADSITLDLGGQPTDFLTWAEHYIDQLDPLSAADHDSDLTPERSYYTDSDRDRLQGELRRLSGYTWDRASKLVAEPTASNDNPTADEDDQDDYWDDED